MICPSDAGKVEATNWMNSFTNGAKGGTGQGANTTLSYSIGLDAAETFPQSFLSTDRNATNTDAPRTTTAQMADNQGPLYFGSGINNTEIAKANKSGWDNNVHQSQGNSCMGDGSVQQLSSARLREQLRNSGTTSNNFVFPGAAK